MGRWDDGGILYDGVASPPLLMDARLHPYPRSPSPFLSVSPYKDLHPTSTYKFFLGKVVPLQKRDKRSFNWFGCSFSQSSTHSRGGYECKPKNHLACTVHVLPFRQIKLNNG